MSKVLATLKREREELKLGPTSTVMEGDDEDGGNGGDMADDYDNEGVNETTGDGGMVAGDSPDGEMGSENNDYDGGE